MSGRMIRAFRFVIFIVAFCLAAAAFVIKYKSRASQNPGVIVSYEQENAEKGLNPDGTRLNVNGITVYTGKDITITPLKSKSPDNDFIATEYKVTSDSLSNDALNSKLLEYATAYDAEYSKMPEFDLNITTGTDYDDNYAKIKNSSSSLRRYLSEMSAKYPDAEADGKSYKTLAKEVDNFIDVDLTNFRAYLMQTGASADKSNSLKRLQYSLENKQNKYDLNTECSGIYKQGVIDYDKAMTSSVLVPTYDNKDSFYMSRTKIGADYLTETANNYTKWASETNDSIVSISDRINSISSGGEYDSSYVETLEKTLSVKLSDLYKKAGSIKDRQFVEIRNEEEK